MLLCLDVLRPRSQQPAVAPRRHFGKARPRYARTAAALNLRPASVAVAGLHLASLSAPNPYPSKLSFLHAPDVSSNTPLRVAPHFFAPSSTGLVAHAPHHGVQSAAHGCLDFGALKGPHKQRLEENPERGRLVADGQQGCPASARHWPYVLVLLVHSRPSC